ncbi:MAG: class I SAM-dependent methyltransferase [Phycisphaerales bacterium]|nr:class I SAM-dependent methyltransferase [Phycisphaerales bacterium]
MSVSASEQHPVYETADEALQRTDEFYQSGGFTYTPDQVHTWLELIFPKPPTGRVLDLCCGDGVWSEGLQRWAPDAELFGIDISAGAIKAAINRLGGSASERFLVGDSETELPWPDGSFSAILARGPGLYNQHQMNRPATIAVIEHWHQKLTPSGVFYSVFASDPLRFGSYTNPLLVKLPYNRAPRLTDAVDFTGGKYHHTSESFMAPFQSATNVEIRDYAFVRKNHILKTRLTRDARS